MEDLVNDDGIDLESLQAQIDLSLAQTQTLVASWLKSSRGQSSSSATSSSRVNQEKEIQELLKRPPRLGVGAPIPASTGTHGHETMKLKGKLSGKKRARETADTVHAVKAAQSDDDEEESRAGAIRKKARVDPFAGSGTKSKKKKAVQDFKPAQTPSVDIPAKHESPEARSAVEVVESPGQARDDAAEPSPSKTKKKKKKHKDSATISEHDMTTSPKQSFTKSVPMSETPRTPPPVKSRTLDVPETPVKPATPHPATTTTPKLSKEVIGLPILNLVGPPPEIDASPSKKRRKRNKKKKKKQDSQAGQSADHVAEAQDEEEEDA